MVKSKINNYFLILFSLLPVSIIVGSSISLINIFLIDLSFLILIFYKREFFFFKNKTIKYLLLLYIYLIFNSFISIDQNIGLSRNFGFLRMIIFFAAFNYFFTQKFFFKKVFLAWSLILMIILIDIFIESFFGQNIMGYGGDTYGKRIVSFFKDEPIVGGYVYAFFLLVCGFLLNYYEDKHKNIIIILLILFLIGIFLTGERSNSIRAFLGVLIFLSLFKTYTLKKKIIYFFSIIFFFGILILNSQYLKLRYIGQIHASLTHNQTYFNIYGSGFEVFKNHKFFGVGNKNYRVETCDVKNQNLETKKKYVCNTHPHQFYFEMLSEHGLFGFILIVIVLYKLIFSKLMGVITSKNYIQIGALIYLILTFLPLLPSGAFFNDYMLTLFMINLSIFYGSCKKLNIFQGEKR